MIYKRQQVDGKNNDSLTLRFSFECIFYDNIEVFIHHFAKNSTLEYSVIKQQQSLDLYIQGSKKQLEDFSDTIAKMPHSLFLKKFEVELADFPETANTTKANYSLPQKLCSFLTPLSLESSCNEFGMTPDINLAQHIAKELLDSKAVVFQDYTLEIFKDFTCDFILPTHLNALPKIFVCDEQSLLMLSSFEKPICPLRINAIYKNANPSTPSFFDIRACFDITLYHTCKILQENGINFLSVKSKCQDLRIQPLDYGFVITQGLDSLEAPAHKLLESLDSHLKKNTALLSLIKSEILLPKQEFYAHAFFSTKTKDYLIAHKDDKDFLLLKVPLPRSYEEIYEALAKQDGGERLLANYQKVFKLPTGLIEIEDNFYSLFHIISKLLDLQTDFWERANDYATFKGAKGVRIDCKLINTNEFDCIKCIRSALSFKLAGASEGNIAFGCVESLALFLSDFSDKLQSEYDSDILILYGALFGNPSLANLALKHSKGFAKLSQRYVLELF